MREDYPGPVAYVTRPGTEIVGTNFNNTIILVHAHVTLDSNGDPNAVQGILSWDWERYDGMGGIKRVLFEHTAGYHFEVYDTLVDLYAQHLELVL